MAMKENERLKSIRTNLGLTQRQFSHSLDIKQGSYSDVERGKAGISSVLLKNLIKKYRINPLWLCEGEGGMFLVENPKGVHLKESSRAIVNMQKESDEDIDFPEEDDQVKLVERQQQYIENIKGLIDFLNE
jgi:transcriptional regulator with XRE-family HTH domain